MRSLNACVTVTMFVAYFTFFFIIGNDGSAGVLTSLLNVFNIYLYIYSGRLLMGLVKDSSAGVSDELMGFIERTAAMCKRIIFWQCCLFVASTVLTVGLIGGNG